MSGKFLLTILLIALTAYRGSCTENTCLCEEGEKLKPHIYQLADAGELDSAMLLYDAIRKINNPACHLLYFHGVAQLYMQKRQFRDAEWAIRSADRLLSEEACTPAIASKHYSIMGLYFTRNSMLDSAQWAYMKAVDYAEKTNNKYAQARAYGDVAAILFKVGNVSKSMEFDTKAVALSRAIAEPAGMALLAAKLVNLASSYMWLYETNAQWSHLDSARQNADDAMQVARKCGDPKGILESYGILSKYHLLTKQFDSCIMYCDLMIQQDIPDFTPFTTYLAYFNKASVAQQKNDVQAALRLADSSYWYAKQFNAEAEIKSLTLIHVLNKQLGQHQKALDAFEKYTVLKDSILSVEKNRAIEELERKYNQAKNEKVIKDLTLQKTIFALLALLGLVTGGFVILYLRQVSMKQRQVILETEQRLNGARMNPHFIFNALTSMQQIALNENNGMKVASGISKFSHIMRETLEFTYQDYISLARELEYLRLYTEVQKIRYPDLFNYVLVLDEALDPDDLMIPAMIIQPIFENSIEHGFSHIQYLGNLHVEFYASANTLIVEIIDNGIGMNTQTEKGSRHMGRATQIIRDRIYLLNNRMKSNAQYQIKENAHGMGVHVKIELPLLYRSDIKE